MIINKMMTVTCLAFIISGKDKRVWRYGFGGLVGLGGLGGLEGLGGLVKFPTKHLNPKHLNFIPLYLFFKINPFNPLRYPC